MAFFHKFQKLDKFYELLKRVPEKNFQTFFYGYCTVNDGKFALANIEEHALIRNPCSYINLLKEYSTKNESHTVKKLLAEMLKSGVDLDIDAYRILASTYALTGFPNDVSHVLRCMTHEGMNPDAKTYKLIIEAYFISKNVQEAQTCFRTIADGDFGDADAISTAMMKGYCEAGLVEEAYPLFLNLSDQTLISDSSLCSTLVHYLLKKGDLEKVEYVFKKTLDLYISLEGKTYMDLVVALLAAEKMEKARLVLEVYLRSYLPENVVFYTALINRLYPANSSKEVDAESSSGSKFYTYTFLLDQRLKMYMPPSPWLKGRTLVFDASDYDQIWGGKKATAELGCMTYTMMTNDESKMKCLEEVRALFDEVDESASNEVQYACLMAVWEETCSELEE